MVDTPICVAITGATGFVGRHLLPQILERGYSARVLSRGRQSPHMSDSQVTVVQGDLFDQRVLAELVQGVNAVVHLVGIIMERPRHGQTFERVHTLGTKNLLNAAQDAGVVRRWIQMSALGARPNAHSDYHRTKWEAEELVRQSGIDFTIFRPSIIHGSDGEFMQMVHDFWCKRFPPFVPYFGGGLFGRNGAGHLQPVWVEDVARCFAEALTNLKAVNETYPVGGPDSLSWPQLYGTCGRYLPRCRKKRIVGIPAWYAGMISSVPGVRGILPFNHDQVIMSQEESTCKTAKLLHDFEFDLAPFEETFADYADRIGLPL